MKVITEFLFDAQSDLLTAQIHLRLRLTSADSQSHLKGTAQDSFCAAYHGGYHSYSQKYMVLYTYKYVAVEETLSPFFLLGIYAD